MPGDVALVGFDNWDVMADACRPPLTSVDMELAELGAEAGRRMPEMIERPADRRRGLVRLPLVRGPRSCGRVIGQADKET